MLGKFLSEKPLKNSMQEKKMLFFQRNLQRLPVM
jgi:hypothetical protein